MNFSDKKLCVFNEFKSLARGPYVAEPEQLWAEAERIVTKQALLQSRRQAP
jgi:hypothetical protein